MTNSHATEIEREWLLDQLQQYPSLLESMSESELEAVLADFGIDVGPVVTHAQRISAPSKSRADTLTKQDALRLVDALQEQGVDNLSEIELDNYLTALGVDVTPALQRVKEAEEKLQRPPLTAPPLDRHLGRPAHAAFVAGTFGGEQTRPGNIGTFALCGVGYVGAGIAKRLHDLGYAAQGSGFTNSPNVQPPCAVGPPVVIGRSAVNVGKVQGRVVLPAVDNPKVALEAVITVPTAWQHHAGVTYVQIAGTDKPPSGSEIAVLGGGGMQQEHMASIASQAALCLAVPQCQPHGECATAVWTAGSDMEPTGAEDLKQICATASVNLVEQPLYIHDRALEKVVLRPVQEHGTVLPGTLMKCGEHGLATERVLVASVLVGSAMTLLGGAAIFGIVSASYTAMNAAWAIASVPVSLMLASYFTRSMTEAGGKKEVLSGSSKSPVERLQWPPFGRTLGQLWPGANIVTLGEAVAHGPTFEWACDRCDRHGRLRADQLLTAYNPDIPVATLLRALAADCPLIGDNACGVHMGGRANVRNFARQFRFNNSDLLSCSTERNS